MHSFHLPPGSFDVLIVSGPDAAKLLQGQLTCDVEALHDMAATRGALCNNKGRVLATFMLMRHGADFFVVLNSGLGGIFMQALKKFLPFYKCELRPYSGVAEGFVGDAIAGIVAPAALPPSSACGALENGWICALDSTEQQYLVLSRGERQAPADAPAGTFSDWLVVGMRSGQFPFAVEDSEKYTPQELHLDRHGYISFTKGCYTGQEIVARLHYRGKLKKLLFLLKAPVGDTSDLASQEFVDGQGGPLGSSVKVLISGGMQYVLAALPAELENKTPGIVKNRAGLEFSTQVF